MAFQSSTIVKRHVPVTHPTPLEAEAEYIAANQERCEVADDLDAEQEVPEPIDDRPEDWAAFERDIEQAQYDLEGLFLE